MRFTLSFFLPSDLFGVLCDGRTDGRTGCLVLGSLCGGGMVAGGDARLLGWLGRPPYARCWHGTGIHARAHAYAHTCICRFAASASRRLHPLTQDADGRSIPPRTTGWPAKRGLWTRVDGGDGGAGANGPEEIVER